MIISCKEIQMNIHNSFVVTRDNRSGSNATNQGEQNRKCAAPNEMDPFFPQHHNGRERHQSKNDIQKEKETLGTHNSYDSPHKSFFADTDAN
jgi:hypothetical protein